VEREPNGVPCKLSMNKEDKADPVMNALDNLKEYPIKLIMEIMDAPSICLTIRRIILKY
jgi:hypothetical protein